MGDRRPSTRSLVATLAIAATVVTGATLIGTVGATSQGASSVFVPITPCRLMDTRPGPPNVGDRAAPLGPGETATFQVHGTNGDCTIPPSATAIATNTTILSPTAPSFLTAYPSDAPRPNASNLNWVAGQAPTPNQVTVALSSDGRVSMFNESGAVDLIVDVVGFFELAPSGGNGSGVDAYSKGESDARYYTRTQADARYYTRTQADGRYYTKTQADGRYYTKTQADGRYYTKTQADERFHLGESVVLVPADGTPTENGAALEAALAGITGAGPDTPFVVQLAPGVYDVGADGVSTVAHVHLRGAGPGTIVTAPGSDDADDGTIRLGDDTVVSDLTVRNTGGSTQYAFALTGHGDRWIVRHVHIEVSGSSTYPSGFVGRSGAGPGELRDVHVVMDTTSGLAAGLGTSPFSGSALTSLTVRDSTIRLLQAGRGLKDPGLAFDGTLWVTNTAIELVGGGAGVEVTDGEVQVYRSVDVRVTGGSGANHGFIGAGSGFAPRIENSHIEVEGSTASAGVRTNNGTVHLSGSTVSAPRGIMLQSGSLSGSVRIDNSVVDASVGLYSDGGTNHTFRVGATRIDATTITQIASGSPTFVCVHSYDGTYSPLNATCG